MPHKDPEVRRRYIREYKATHKEQILAGNKRYIKEHPFMVEGWRLKTVYGITRAELDVMVLDQMGRCKLCQKVRRLLIDHDHQTGKVRGLLCRPCNVYLANIEADPEILKRIEGYLK